MGKESYCVLGDRSLWHYIVRASNYEIMRDGSLLKYNLTKQ